MTTILVVDDSVLDRHVAGALLEEHAGWTATFSEDGRDALAQIKAKSPDLVLTDLQMPELNGLELVEAIRHDFPAVPVILMTAHGSEDIAVAALKVGAASYVPKKNWATDLVPTVESVLQVTKIGRNHQLVQSCLSTSEFFFVLTNDTAPLQPIIGHLQDHMVQRNLIDKNSLIRVGTALYEVLLNAIEHGNLELSSELREVGNGSAYKVLGDERRRLKPFSDRRVYLRATFSREEAVFVIRDEGAGYDAKKLPDPTDPTNLERSSGRGMFLIRTFMDDVRVNDKGNEITLVKRQS